MSFSYVFSMDHTSVHLNLARFVNKLKECKTTFHWSISSKNSASEKIEPIENGVVFGLILQKMENFNITTPKMLY